MKIKPKLENLDLGYLTEKKVQSKLIEKGFSVFEPNDEGGTVDLLCYKNNIFKRLQVKTATYDSLTDRFRISLQRTRHQRYDYSEFDYFVSYLYEIDIFYVIPVNILKEQKMINVYPHREKSLNFKKKVDYEKFKENFDQLSNQ